MAIKAFRGMHPASQLLFSLFIIVVCFIVIFIVALIAAIPLFGLDSILSQLTSIDYNNQTTINLLKFMQTVQSLGIFLVPPIIIAYLFDGSVGRYLQMNKDFKVGMVLIAFVLILVANPAINFLGSINENMRLPEWMSGMEAKMKEMEQNAAFLLDKFMDVKTTGGLLFNILMIAVIPAFGEEFLFRGVIQRIFSEWTRSYHWGIWISAILFSALHMQFYGFIPRVLLGALFGYMLVWSGSIWVPVLAHFFNNAAGVLGLYFINKGAIDSSIEDIGSGTDHLPVAIASFLLTGLLLFVAYKQKKETRLTV